MCVDGESVDEVIDARAAMNSDPAFRAMSVGIFIESAYVARAV